MYKIHLTSEFSGVHMGLVFANGTAQTDDAFLATRLKSKGYTVTAEKGADDTKAPEQMEEPEGKKVKGKKSDDKKIEEKKRDSNRNKPANNTEPTSAPEPTPEATVEPTSGAEPESNEPSNLPPLDNEDDE